MNNRFQSKKCLVICYSYGGNTWQVAEEISRQTGAPLCEIYPKQPYSMLFESLLAQVENEIAEGFLPSLFPIPEQVEDYDTIFVGTPNWCGTIAPPLISFLKKNPMEGKTLIPFYTHCGGGRWMIERDIQELCPKAIVQDAIGIVSNGGDNLSEEIHKWIS